MQSQLLALVILTSLFQVKREWKPVPPVPAPRRQSTVIHVGVRVGGNAQRRTISIAMPVPPAPEDEDDEKPPPPPIRRFNLNTAIVERENFDRWLFDDEQSESEHRRYLEALLQAKLEIAAREHKLTDLERAKLRLAGMGDIKRFFDLVEESRTDFEVARQSFRTGHAALLQLEPLSEIYLNGASGNGSLFCKTLSRIAHDHEKPGR